MKIILTEGQFRNLFEYSVGGCDFFDIESTGMSFYDNIIHNRGKNENIEFKIVDLSVDDYFKLIVDEDGKSYGKEKHLSSFSMSEEKVLNVMKGMESGVKYHIPIYDFRDGFQEGRHRIIAADRLGCVNIPVALFGYDIDSKLNSRLLGKV